MSTACYRVRTAGPADVDAVFDLGMSDTAFAVSERIRFYEKPEVAEWIASPGDNLFLVVHADGTLAGFAYAKLMSAHWAMLDNFYVRRENRDSLCGRMLLEELLRRLRARRISYVSTLISAQDRAMSRYLRRFGFSCVKTLAWHERFIDE